jgi:hypothetical protein
MGKKYSRQTPDLDYLLRRTRVLASTGSSGVDPTALHPGDNVSLLVNDAGYLTAASVVDAAVPYFIPSGDTFVVAINKQALFNMPIDIEGDLVVDGYLIEVA